MKKYQLAKNRARKKATQWQLEYNENNYSMLDLANFGNYFYRLGKRFGLLKEFRQNGIF